MNALRLHTTRAMVGLGAIALLGGCTETSSPSTTTASADESSLVSLTEIDRCDQLAELTRARLEPEVEARWWEPPEPGVISRVFGGIGDWIGGSSDESYAADAGAATSIAEAPMAAAESAPDSADAGGTQGTTAAGGQAEREPSVIGTNNQEAAVDEADLVKTDGRRIVSIVNGVMRVTTVDGEPNIDGAIDLTGRGATEMFLRGDTVLVIGATYGNGGVGVPEPMPMPMPMPMPPVEPMPTVPPETAPSTVPNSMPEPSLPQPTTTAPAPEMPTTTLDDVSGSDGAASSAPAGPLALEPATSPGTVVPPATAPAPFNTSATLTVVSIQDPTKPEVVASTDVEGDYVAARQIGDTARIIIRSNPFHLTEQVYSAQDKASALDAVARVNGEDVLPRQSVDGEIRPVGSCDDVLVLPAAATEPSPDERSGTSDAIEPAMGGMYSPTSELSTVTVLTVGDDLANLAPTTVQGNAETVYASSDALYLAAGNWGETGTRTDIHRFDLRADGAATHTGSGSAPGRMLNQFSLSEREGALRVVTTVDGQAATSARLTNLDTDGTLDEVGHLDGMGIGEEVKSVRFLDDLGYVVTFRQTDPLYALDLSDPANPRQLGELKIPGFSEYLHPIGDGLLLGVGSDADPTTGRTTGAKVSLFDVSDPSKMAEVDQVILPDGWSPVAQDHKAFLWDPQRQQAVIPLNGSAGGAAAVFRVDGRSLRNIAQIQHETSPWSEAPVRSMVIDDGLWTLSSSGLGLSDANDPSSVVVAAFG